MSSSILYMVRSSPVLQLSVEASRKISFKRMMQSRLATTSYRVFFSVARNRGLASAPTSSRTADPEIYSAEPEIREELVHPEESDKKDDPGKRKEDAKPGQETAPFGVPKLPYAAASHRLESSGVNHPLDPTTRQKRSISIGIEDAICAAGVVDEAPLPGNKEEERKRREAEEEDDKAYYSHHKASPLAEIEMVDTRKPITRATDGTYRGYEGEKEVTGWLPEQLETAEETLEKAARMWREAATRGDPDSPQSRALRALRGCS